MDNLQHDKLIQEKRMNPEDIALMLSKTMRDFAERKVTARYVLAMSRIGIALSKTIEVVDLKKRVEFIEQALKKKV